VKKKEFWFTVNIGCVETAGCSSGVVHAVADILTYYCIVFQRWQKRFWGADNILFCVYTHTHTHTQYIS